MLILLGKKTERYCSKHLRKQMLKKHTQANKTILEPHSVRNNTLLSVSDQLFHAFIFRTPHANKKPFLPPKLQLPNAFRT